MELIFNTCVPAFTLRNRNILNLNPTVLLRSASPFFMTLDNIVRKLKVCYPKDRVFSEGIYFMMNPCASSTKILIDSDVKHQLK
jgi:hypothetical protein